MSRSTQAADADPLWPVSALDNDPRYGLSALLGEFINRATEHRYRRHVQPYTVRHLHRVLVVWGVIWSMFAILDFQAFGLGAVFATLLALRLGFLAVLAIGGLMVHRRPVRATRGYVVTLIATVAFSELFIFCAVSADATVYWMIAINMVFLIMLFVLVPNRTIFSAAVALYGVVGTIACAALTLDSMAPVGVVALTAMLFTPTIAGWFAAQRFEITRRREFAALEQARLELDHRRELETELQRQARTDSLTGASNRRDYEAAFDQEYRRARRYDRPLALCLLDIDHFKRVNDRYGHSAGDSALIRLTDACRNEMRRADILGRLGGEEFVLILPETTRDNALELAERLRERLADMVIETSAARFQITVTLGVTTLTEQDTGITDMLERADAALYHAKAAGRNRVLGA